MRGRIAVLSAFALILTLASCTTSFTRVITESGPISPIPTPMEAASPIALVCSTQHEGWTTCSAPELHLSFAYPSHWSLYTPDPQPVIHNAVYNSYILTLFPPTGDLLSGNKIELSYSGYEIPEGQSLQTWAELGYRLDAESDLPPPMTIISPQTLTEPDGSPRQVLHVAASAGLGPSQAVLLTRGHLVLVIVSYTHDEAMGGVLEGIAASVQFDPGAPGTLNELYSTDRVWSSQEEVLQRLDAIRRNALPTCDIVCRDAAASKEILSTPTVTPGATP
jgi:hypothetical protein